MELKVKIDNVNVNLPDKQKDLGLDKIDTKLMEISELVDLITKESKEKIKKIWKEEIELPEGTKNTFVSNLGEFEKHLPDILESLRKRNEFTMTETAKKVEINTATYSRDILKKKKVSLNNLIKIFKVLRAEVNIIVKYPRV